MNKGLITGAGGQLGQALSTVQPHEAGLKIIYALRSMIDITQLTALRTFLIKNQIEFIINCAAYTQVDEAETEQEATHTVNVIGAENLAKMAQELDITLLHISTDYVFKGHSNQPLDETMPTIPINYYGYTKLLGEQSMQAYQAKIYIIRTSWLYSNSGVNTFTKLFKRAITGEKIFMAYDQVSSPTYAIDLAQAIWQIILILRRKDNNCPTGVYHYANQGVASKYDFVWNICKMAHWKNSILPARTANFKGFAPRPAYTVLDTQLIQRIFALTIPHWQESLAKFLAKRNEHLI